MQQQYGYSSILEAIRDHADHSPAVVCLREPGQEITYLQYWNDIVYTCKKLEQHGLKKGDAVAIRTTQSIAYLTVLHAVQLAGGIPVPLEKNCGEQRVEEIAQKTRAIMVLSGEDRAKAPEEAQRCTHEAPLPGGQDTSLILFTTGTTGSSKGIQLCHAADVAVAENVQYGVEMKPTNVEVLPMPLNHSYALRRYFSSMLNGSCCILLDGMMNIRVFFDMLKNFRATSIAMAPSALSIMLKLSQNEIAKYADQIDYMQFGSAPLPETDKAKILELLPGSRLYNLYGSTEAGCACILDFNSEADRPYSIGWPTKNSRVAVVDEEGHEIQSSERKTGFLIWGGGMLMDGYYADPDLTAQTMRNGYIHTRDIGYVDDAGRVYMLGRADDVINVGGMKVSPSEVENVVESYPGILECACAPRQDQAVGTHTVLYYVADEAVDTQNLRTYMAQRLEPYKLPRWIEQIEALPRTYNGKLDRKQLI